MLFILVLPLLLTLQSVRSTDNSGIARGSLARLNAIEHGGIDATVVPHSK
jgi:hypothetical protein